ncbi:glycosyltransferase involved in cell wall biosynthesis [Pseudonocardia sediminis]|uniref:Glycosyltransferase involved in cell wall biosynthesis n=1 Tax=Pseudonocardia sediminis TaxID=1397368 RepID=A0A4Q7UYR0_PSEST|nr:glycosyltransferase [Pseudonocardia sediminis]RZT87267.1 glycosyltransferase involved in cell wall biosynthesis [Pseudonocardia sediminis]
MDTAVRARPRPVLVPPGPARVPGVEPQPGRAAVRRHVALIASAHHPIREPFAGGLEAHTWELTHRLRERGHRVDAYAAAGSDPGLDVHAMTPVPIARSGGSAPAGWFMAEHHAHLAVMRELAATGSGIDLVHNNSLHYLPLSLADTLAVPVLTTLHTPPIPWLETVIRARRPGRRTFAAVSEYTAAQWRACGAEVRVVRNGVDTARWTPGPGGGSPVWSGRIVPEKGPVEAIRAARLAGTGLRLAGPVSDPRFFDDAVAPLLGDGVSYVGHLGHQELARLVGSASVAVVSPCWDEPYGLVVAEALACGTPVAGFARGALPEIVDRRSGVLAAPGDVDALAVAIRRAEELDRADARDRAVTSCSAAAMIAGYEALYAEMCA